LTAARPQWPRPIRPEEVRKVKISRSRIAVAATVLGLGGLAGAALSADRQQPPATTTGEPIVRTRVIHRTVHVTRHLKPEHPPAASQGVGAGPGAEAAPPAYPAQPTATTGASGGSGSYAGEFEAAQVTTSTSGGGAAAEPVEDDGEIELESEGSDD
jgi:hypothetical protein